MYCYHLNLNLEPLKFKLNLEDYLPTGRSTSNLVKFELSDINPYLVKLLNERNIKIGWAEMFIKSPQMTEHEAIHIDEFRGDFVKLNWIWRGAGSTMRWYKELQPNNEIPTTGNELNAPYLGFNSTDVAQIHTEALSGPCIIQAGIPHNVVMGSDFRWALSFVLLDATSGFRKRLSMATSLAALSDLRRI